MAIPRTHLLLALSALAGYLTLDNVMWRLALQAVKLDLTLTDTQLGLLSGIAYTVFYAVLGIPIARWADRGFAMHAIVLSTAVSGISVALQGACQNIWQLMFVRIGVAFGDAGCSAPAHALIAKYFGRTERPLAMGRYHVLVAAITILGTATLGLLVERIGWRYSFVTIGVPGLALAGLAWIFFSRPSANAQETAEEAKATKADDTAESAKGNPSSYRQDLATLWANRTFLQLLLSWVMFGLLGSGLLQWNAAFLVRSFGVGTGQLGLWLSVPVAFNLLGTYAGGALASRVAAANESRQTRAIAVVIVAYGLVTCGVYLAPDIQWAIAFKAIASLVGGMMMAPIYSLVVSVVPANLRATSIALMLFATSVMGSGIGPLAVGWLSDALGPAVGHESLRYALLAICPGYFLAGLILWKASRTVTHDLILAQAR